MTKDTQIIERKRLERALQDAMHNLWKHELLYGHAMEEDQPQFYGKSVVSMLSE